MTSSAVRTPTERVPSRSPMVADRSRSGRTVSPVLNSTFLGRPAHCRTARSRRAGSCPTTRGTSTRSEVHSWT